MLSHDQPHRSRVLDFEAAQAVYSTQTAAYQAVAFLQRDAFSLKVILGLKYSLSVSSLKFRVLEPCWNFVFDCRARSLFYWADLRDSTESRLVALRSLQAAHADGTDDTIQPTSELCTAGSLVVLTLSPNTQIPGRGSQCSECPPGFAATGAP